MRRKEDRDNSVALITAIDIRTHIAMADIAPSNIVNRDALMELKQFSHDTGGTHSHSGGRCTFHQGLGESLRFRGRVARYTRRADGFFTEPGCRGAFSPDALCAGEDHASSSCIQTRRGSGGYSRGSPYLPLDREALRVESGPLPQP